MMPNEMIYEGGIFFPGKDLTPSVTPVFLINSDEEIGSKESQ